MANVDLEVFLKGNLVYSLTFLGEVPQISEIETLEDSKDFLVERHAFGNFRKYRNGQKEIRVYSRKISPGLIKEILRNN